MKSMCPHLAISVLGLSVACTDNGGGNGNDDTAPSGGDDSAVETGVWEDLTHTPSTADTFYGVYAEGNQVWVAVSGGAVEVLEGKKTWTRYDAASTPPMSQGKISVEHEDMRGIWGDGAGIVKAVGDSGKIASWTGAGWQMEDIGTAGLEAIDGLNAGNLMIGGWGGIFTNATGDWEGPFQLTGNPLMNHLWYNGSVGIAVGANGARATFGGADWALNSDAELRTLYGVHGLSLDDAWAVGEHGIAFHYDGEHWEEYDTGTEVSLWAVWMITKDSVYAVGNNGTAVHWDGKEWSSLATGGRANLYGIYGVGENDVWACGASGALFHYGGAPSESSTKK